MSVQKSTIDRIVVAPRRRPTAGSRSAGARSAASPETVSRADTRSRFAGPREDAVSLAAPRSVRAALAVLERTSPAASGWLAERLWFRLRARPDAAVRASRTPPGGEAFEVSWTDHAHRADRGREAHHVVRGRVYGEWGNPTAYLVHGWGGWWQQLSAHVQPLVDQGMCVVAFDAPSHGDSGPGAFGARSTTFVEMSQALSAVVGEFGRPTVVIAHSAGGMATLHALGHGVSPDSLVLIAPPSSVEGMLRAFGDVLRLGRRTREVMARRAEHRVGLAVAELDLITMAAGQPSLPHLLVVHDRDDVEAEVAGAVALVDAWHDARLLLTDGLGHRRLMWDRAVVERVSAFAGQAAERVRRSSR